MTDPKILGDRYELDEVVGRGGMAEVWRGRDVRLGRTVAIKMLRVDHSSDSTFQERFRREAQSAASLNHHNIVAVYDTGEDMLNGHRIPFIVMEYVEGHTLRELVRDHARFTPERCIEVMIATLDALEYSHRAGIVHRDIKPGNIMITNNGEVKVMDFGIARSLADTGMALTQTAAVVGTAQYISPEQARGEQADARSDLYATGCVLYELLTGRPPFVGDSLVSVAVSHVREMAALPSALDPSVPPELDSIVMKSLAKDRRERYQSAYEMQADLQRAAAGLPVAAASDVAASTQLMGGTAVTQAYNQQPTTYEDQRYDDYDDEDSGGVPVWAVVLGTLAALAIAGLIGFLLFRDDSPATVTVPRVIGMSQQEAEQTLTNEDLSVTVETREAENDDEIGNVVAQSPEPSTQAEEGDTVTITIGQAPEEVEVPDVVGDNVDDARTTLQNAGLTVDVADETVETDDEAQDGTVESTSPGPGESVEPETTVTLTVYALPDTITLIDLTGMHVDDAVAWLEDNDLVPDIRERDDEAESGTVLETEPGGGNTVEPGGSVVLHVSTGEPAGSELPNVSGGDLDVTAATAQLNSAGFTNVSAVEQETCDYPEGIVWNQDPAAGEEVPGNSPVTIFYAVPPAAGCEGDEGDGVLD